MYSPAAGSDHARFSADAKIPSPKLRDASHPRRSRQHPTPSVTLLAMLATFCAESVVAIHPVAYRCPNFLCPFLAQPSLRRPLTAPSSKAHRPQPLPKRKNPPSRRSLPNGNVPQKLPTKYLKGQDGRYRPESSWSLHGQTLTCTWVVPSPSAIDEMDNVDSPVSPATAVGLPDNSALSTPSSTYLQPPDDLPAGWASPESRSGFYKVPVIVVFALTLTLFITVLIASCALLRRKRRLRTLSARKKEVDSEVEQGPDDIEDPSLARRIRRQKKAWVRSSARWRSSARLALRRRRGKNTVYPSSGCLNSIHATSSPSIISDSSPHLPDEPTMGEISTSRLVSLPPAYPSRTEEPSDLPEARAEMQAESGTHKPLTDPHLTSVLQEIQVLPSTSVHGAHVATDDKAVLERLANSASAPAEAVVHDTPQVPDWSEDSHELHAPDPAHSHFPLPGLPVEPTIFSAYDEVDVVALDFIPSSPLNQHLADAPSAPPIDEDVP